MKKLLAILCLLCVSVSAFAYAEENTIVFGGSEPTYLEPNAPAVGGPEIHVVEQILEGLCAHEQRRRDRRAAAGDGLDDQR